MWESNVLNFFSPIRIFLFLLSPSFRGRWCVLTLTLGKIPRLHWSHYYSEHQKGVREKSWLTNPGPKQMEIFFLPWSFNPLPPPPFFVFFFRTKESEKRRNWKFFCGFCVEVPLFFSSSTLRLFLWISFLLWAQRGVAINRWISLALFPQNERLPCF